MADWEAVARELVDARYGVLVGYARLVAGTAADPEDLVQDALISTFGRRRTFASVPEAESYVRKAIVSRFIDKARRSSRTKRTVLADSPVAGHAEAVDLSLDLAAALDRLPPRERACVVLRHLDGLSVSQTSEVLGVAEGTVKRYVADGLTKLNALLGTADAVENHVTIQTHKGGAK